MTEEYFPRKRRLEDNKNKRKIKIPCKCGEMKSESAKSCWKCYSKDNRKQLSRLRK